jgi:uncharacterized protein YbbK (DUF523 family)
MVGDSDAQRRRGHEDRSPVLRLGVSRCLLGESVRYDGAHKRYPWVADELGNEVVWIGVCPEVEMGMPVPREPVQLEGPSRSPRMLGVESREDHTCAMHRWSGDKLRELAVEDLDGFVLKARSPSCGLRDAELLDARMQPSEHVSGLFAAALARIFPHLPLTSEARLESHGERERFLNHARCYQAFKRAVAEGASEDSLQRVQALALRGIRERGLDASPMLEEGYRRARSGGAEELAAYGQLLHDLLAG